MNVWADVRKPLQPDEPPPEMPPVWATPEDQPATLATPVADVRGPHMELSTDTANRADLDKIANHDQKVHDINQLAKVRWNQEHPWGSPENHPGHLGKLAHVFSQIGNIAGNIVAPNVMARIPGTQLGMQQEAAGLENNIDTEQQHEAENELRGAQAGNLESETETRKAELPFVAPTAEAKNRVANAQATELEQTAAAGPNLAIGHAHAVNQAIARGVDPAQDPLVQQYEDAIQRLQKQPAPKSREHVNLQDAHGKPIGATFDPGTGKYFDASGKEIANPVPYEKPTNINVGTWSVQNDTSGKPILFNSKTGETREAPGNLARKPNAEEEKRADLAENVNENLNTLEEIVTRRPDLFGPMAGRVTGLKQAFGTSDPDIATLKTVEDNLGMALQSAHGMRSAQHVAVSAQSVLNGLKNTPEALKGAIKAARQSVGTFQHDVTNTNEAGHSEPKVLKFNPATGRLE